MYILLCVFFLFIHIFYHFFLYCRVKHRLESLTTSLIAWKQFEYGINEFKEVLGKDTGALKRLTGALEMGTDVISHNLAYDVKEVAKRLSEKMDNQCNITTATSQQVQYLIPHSCFCFPSKRVFSVCFYTSMSTITRAKQKKNVRLQVNKYHFPKIWPTGWYIVLSARIGSLYVHGREEKSIIFWPFSRCH